MSAKALAFKIFFNMKYNCTVQFNMTMHAHRQMVNY